MPNVRSDAAVGDFLADLNRLIGPVSPDVILGIAFSGGPDSLALLLLAHAALPGQIRAATVDHQLRRESADESAHCASVCASLGIAHDILTPAQAITGSVQAAARSVRYALLHTWADEQGIVHILTAHHADDQAETMMMRLNRGSGIAGLAGIRAVNGRVVRPVLTWRRERLASIVAASGCTALSDPSNRDDRFDRARIRKALASANWIDAAAMASTAATLADAEVALVWATEQAAEKHLQTGDQSCTIVAPGSLPTEIRRRLVGRALTTLDPACLSSGPETMRLMASLLAGGKASIGALIGENRGGDWHFTKAPPRSPRNAVNSA